MSGDWVVIEPADLVGQEWSMRWEGADISLAKKAKGSDEEPDGNGNSKGATDGPGRKFDDNHCHVLVSSFMLSDSDTESFHNLTINEHYAKAFQYKKEREELQKCLRSIIVHILLTTLTTVKEKYGSDFDDDDDESEDDSESDESEDEDGQELTPNVDAAILRTLARIKRKDPAIYNTDKNIFVGVYDRLELNATTTYSFFP